MPKKTQQPHTGTLYIGDNLPIMLEMPDESVDLIYLDPPFKTETFRLGKTEEKHSFDDTWSERELDFAHAVNLKFKYPQLWKLIQLAKEMHSPAMESYLEFMASRLVQMHRLLKPTGSLYLHCDPNANYYLRQMLDCIFGRRNFRNEIMWCYSGPTRTSRWFPRKYDSIIWYSKGNQWTFNADDVRIKYSEAFCNRRKYTEGKEGASGIMSGYKGGRSEEEVSQSFSKGKVAPDWWDDIPSGGQMSKKERTGYSTQKPLKLLNRIIAASSRKGDVVMDPFCGCATACIAAAGLHRKWIGIDQNEKVAGILQGRLTEDLSTHKFVTNMPADAKLTKKVSLPKPKFDYPGKITRRQAWEMLIQMDVAKRQAPFCRGCFAKPSNYKLLQPDHILADSKGGLSVIENFQLLCADCNHKKGNRDMEFLYRVLDEEKESLRRQVAQRESQTK